MIAALALSTALALTPQGEEGKERDRFLTALKLEISTIKDTLDPIDLLQFTVRFTNTSDAPLKLELDSTLPGLAGVQLVDPEGRSWYPVTLEVKGSFGPLIVVLNPGEYYRVHGTYSLCYKRLLPAGNSFKLPQAGTWKVWAKYGRSAGTVKTNEATFQIRENGRMPPNVRALFSCEAWHRFAVGGEVSKSDLFLFRTFVLSGVEEGQRDVMAFRLGFRGIERLAPHRALEMFKAAADSRLGNLDRVDAILWKVHGLWASNCLDEALTLLNQVEADPKDVVRRRMEEMRSGITRTNARIGKPVEGK